MAIRWIQSTQLINPSSPSADSATLAASWILYKLTGEKYPGVSYSTETYIVDRNRFTPVDYGAAQQLLSVAVFEVKDIQSRNLTLRRRPALSVDEVLVNGSVLPIESYVLVNNAYLARLDGGFWDFDQGVTVSYSHGSPPPEIGVRAAIRLANELIYLNDDPDQCALPDRVTSVSRQGISYAVLDPQTFLDQGKTGMYEVDLFIKTANPYRARKKAKMFSPDIPKGRRVV